MADMLKFVSAVSVSSYLKAHLKSYLCLQKSRLAKLNYRISQWWLVIAEVGRQY